MCSCQEIKVTQIGRKFTKNILKKNAGNREGNFTSVTGNLSQKRHEENHLVCSMHFSGIVQMESTRIMKV